MWVFPVLNSELYYLKKYINMTNKCRPWSDGRIFKISFWSVLFGITNLNFVISERIIIIEP